MARPCLLRLRVSTFLPGPGQSQLEVVWATVLLEGDLLELDTSD